MRHGNESPVVLNGWARPLFTKTIHIVVWEDGEGRLHETVGWELSRDDHTLLLAADVEQCNTAESVTGATTEIPVANIHFELTTRRPYDN